MKNPKDFIRCRFYQLFLSMPKKIGLGLSMYKGVQYIETKN